MTDALRVRRGSSTSPDPSVAAAELHAAIGADDARLVILYASPSYDLARLGAELRERFGTAAVIGCTTAGEITPQGYLSDALTGVSLAGEGLEVRTARIDGLHELQMSRGGAVAFELRGALEAGGQATSGRDCFAFLLADGLRMQEESLVASLHGNLGDIPLFGGSAGDGVRFGQTFLYHDGEFRTDCALVTLVRCPSPFEVFKTEHFVAGSERMVVTGADPANRVVTEINGLPAGREYARVVGLDVDALTPFVFAAHPVVVRVGGQLFVRSIQKVNEDESLTFFCAIDEGIVLTVAKGVDMVQNLEHAFDAVRARLGPPAVVLGCDCILRRIEAEQTGVKARIGEILAANHVVGFATYGEQFNGMHVNQTFTGVAIGAGAR